MSQQTFHGVNPATGEQLNPPFVEASGSDVDAAARAAKEAFAQVADLPPRWPAELLEAIADRVTALGDALLERVEAETALPRPRLVGERARTVNQLKMFASIAREGSWVDAAIDTADAERKPLPKPDLRRMLVPRGPVAVFGASNFPLAFGVVGGDTASALAAACAVLVKGHPSHPGTNDMIARAVAEAVTNLRLPRGVFTLLQGRSHELGAQLVKHADITAVGFTGSLDAGRALFDVAASRPIPIPVYAEMGSVNPVVILPGAIAERAEKIAPDLAASVLLGGGQFCTKPGLIFTIGDDVHFVELFAKAITSQTNVTMLNQSLRENFSRRAGEIAATPGVRAIATCAACGFAGTSATLFEADAATWKREHQLQEEAFGPGAIVIHCKDQSEAIDCIDTLQGNLTGTVHLSSDDDARQILRHLQAKVGRVIVNGYPTGVEVCNAIVHGGPYPATTDPGTTSVGSAAIRRWVRLLAYQDTPDALLPPALQNANPLKIERVVNGRRTSDPIAS